MRQYHFGLGTGWSRMRDCNESHGAWIEGSVLTIFGIVLAYSQGGNGNANHTTLEFVCNRRCYVRSWERRYTKRGVSRLAKQFAEDVFYGRKAPTE
jgi:hypothetical protein